MPQRSNKQPKERAEMALGKSRSRRKADPAVEDDVQIVANDATDNTEENTVTEPEFSWNSGQTESVGEEVVEPTTVETVTAAESADAEQKQTAEQKAAAEKELIQNAYPTNAKVVFVKTDWKGQYGVIVGLEEKRNVTYVKVRLTHYVNRTERPADKQQTWDVRPASIEVVDEVPAPDVKPEPKADAVTADNA